MIELKAPFASCGSSKVEPCLSSTIVQSAWICEECESSNGSLQRWLTGSALSAYRCNDPSKQALESNSFSGPCYMLHFCTLLFNIRQTGHNIKVDRTQV
jgi:hypothetical protein